MSPAPHVVPGRLPHEADREVRRMLQRTHINMLKLAILFSAVLCFVLFALPGRSVNQQSDEPLLSLEAARQYMLEMINRDRSTAGLAPVSLEPTATAAAQLHCDAMAKGLFNAHFHPDGSKPVQRYNQVGGLDYVAENSRGLITIPPWEDKLSPDQRFTKSDIEKEQAVYFDEKPPHDGHRLNILDGQHTHVGIGLNMMDCSTPSGQRYRYLISTQEFVNKYGSYKASARSLSRNGSYKLIGKLSAGFQPYAVDIYFEKEPQPIPIEQLRKDQKYNHYENGERKIAWTFLNKDSSGGSLHSKPDGSFEYELKTQPGWKPGLYYVLLWARDQTGKNIPVSIQALPLR